MEDKPISQFIHDCEDANDGIVNKHFNDGVCEDMAYITIAVDIRDGYQPDVMVSVVGDHNAAAFGIGKFASSGEFGGLMANGLFIAADMQRVEREEKASMN